ncbi:MAG: helicase-associated domain-containing protein [Armatimonadetes bacterium]|nr:helicase-associated domain-containing protein [Armatimonadota bacterium]
MADKPFNVGELLESLSVVYLKAIGAKRGLPRASSLKKLELIAQLESTLYSEEWLSQLADGLEPRELRLLQEIKRKGGKMSGLAVRYRLMLRGAPNPYRVVSDLMKQGLLFPTPGRYNNSLNYWDKSGRRHYYDQDDEVWIPQPVLGRLPDREPLRVSFAPVDLPKDARRIAHTFSSIQTDLLLLFRYFHAQKAKPLKSGGVAAKDYKAVGAMLTGAKERGLDPLEWAQLLAGLAVAGKLIVPQGERFHVSDSSNSLLQRPRHEQAKLLLEAWCGQQTHNEFLDIPTLSRELYGNSLGPDIPQGQQLSDGRRTLTEILEQTPPGAWIPVNQLVVAVQEVDPEFLIPFQAALGSYHSYSSQRESPLYEGFFRAGAQDYATRRLRKMDNWDEVEGAYLRHVVETSLCWLGLVEVAKSKDEILYCLTPLAEEVFGHRTPESQTQQEECLVVQPNFEVVLYLDRCDVATRFGLDQIAEHLNSDKVGLYRLTRDSVYRALEHGWSLKKLTSFLEAHSTNPLPQAVAYSLNEWAQYRERIHVQAGVRLLVAESEEEMQQAVSVLPSASVRRLTPTAAVVTNRKAKDAAKALKNAGLEVIGFDYEQEAAGCAELTKDLQVKVKQRDYDWYLRGELAKFAELVADQGDPVVYRITPESLNRAVETYGSYENAEQALGRHVASPCPTEAIARLRGLRGLLKGVTLAPAFLLKAESDQQMDLWLSVKEICGHISSRPAPGIALVDPAYVEELRQALANLNIPAGEAALPRQKINATKSFHLAYSGYTQTRASDYAEPVAPAPPTRQTEESLRTPAPENVISPDESDLIAMIEQSIEQGDSLMIEYQTRNSPAPRWREVKPLHVWDEEDVYYMTAYCPEHDSERHFRLSRIQAVEIQDEP